MAQNFVIPSDHQVRQIAFIIQQYRQPFPYELNYIVSNCVKEAANPLHIPEMTLINEVKHNVRGMDQELNRMLIDAIKSLIHYLTNIFIRNGWYETDRTAPHRFIGYASSDLYDIELRRL